MTLSLSENFSWPPQISIDGSLFLSFANNPSARGEKIERGNQNNQKLD